MLTIRQTVNASESIDERVSINVDESGNLQGYAIVDKTFDQDGLLANTFRHFFAFPNHDVEAGDFVRLISGIGENRIFRNKAGTRTHEFYWNSASCIWNDEGDTASILQYSIVDQMNVSPI